MNVYVIEKYGALFKLEPQIFYKVFKFKVLNRFRLLHKPLLIKDLNPNNMDLNHIPLKITSNLDNFF